MLIILQQRKPSIRIISMDFSIFFRFSLVRFEFEISRSNSQASKKRKKSERRLKIVVIKIWNLYLYLSPRWKLFFYSCWEQRGTRHQKTNNKKYRMLKNCLHDIHLLPSKAKYYYHSLKWRCSHSLNAKCSTLNAERKLLTINHFRPSFNLSFPSIRLFIIQFMEDDWMRQREKR